MELELEPADAKRAKADNAVPLFTLVGGFDSLKPKRRLRVHIGDRLDGRILLPMRRLDQLYADGAGGEHDLRTFEVFGARSLICALHWLDLHAEARLDRLHRLLGAFLHARGERDLGAPTDRTGAGEHYRLLSL